MTVRPSSWTALLLAFLFAGAANAQNFPTKPVRIIVPFPAGGSADFFSRMIGQKLSESWSQQVIVENRPGVLNYSGVGPGATQHIAGEMLKAATKIDMGYVPFAGGAPAVLAVLGGHVGVCIANIQEVAPHVEAGKLRALAVTSRERDPAMKNVPTVAESGYPDYVVITWWGFSAPGATPADVVAKISADTGRVLKLPEIQGKLLSQGLYASPSTPEQFTAHIRAETARYAKIVKEAGIKAD